MPRCQSGKAGKEPMLESDFENPGQRRHGESCMVDKKLGDKANMGVLADIMH